MKTKTYNGISFDVLTKQEEELLSKEERREYLLKLRDFYNDNRWIENLTLEQRKKIYPLIRGLFIADNLIKGNKIVVLGDKDKLTKIKKANEGRSIIYANTHIGQPDVEVAGIVLNSLFYLFSGDFENLHNGLDSNLLCLNGVKFYDMTKFPEIPKESEKKESQRALTANIEALNNGIDLLWYIEQIWNILSENSPVLYAKWGIIKAAHDSNSIILPMAMEQYDKKFYVVIGEPFEVDKFYKDGLQKGLTEDQIKLNAITALRDELATLKWQIWSSAKVAKKDLADTTLMKENFTRLLTEGKITREEYLELLKMKPVSRDSIPDNYWQEYQKKRLKEWNFTEEDIIKKEFHNPFVTPPSDAFSYVTVNELNEDYTYDEYEDSKKMNKNYYKRKKKN